MQSRPPPGARRLLTAKLQPVHLNNELPTTAQPPASKPKPQPLYRRFVPRTRTLDEGIVLDGFKLLTETDVDLPEQAVRALIEGLSISEAVPADLAYFTNLKYLDAGDNNIPMEQLGTLNALEELHLHLNGIQHIPRISGLFTSLTILGLGFNQTTQKSIKHLMMLPNLQELDLANNALAKLPRDLSRFRSLRKLSLRGNELHTEASLVSCGTIPNLRELDLSENFFPEVYNCVGKKVEKANCQSVCEFAELGFLDISYNKIVAEEDCYGLCALPALEIVDLRGNELGQRYMPMSNEALWRMYPKIFKRLVCERLLTVVLREPRDAMDGHDLSHVLKAPTPDAAIKSSADTPQEEASNADGGAAAERLMIQGSASGGGGTEADASVANETFLTEVEGQETSNLEKMLGSELSVKWKPNKLMAATLEKLRNKLATRPNIRTSYNVRNVELPPKRRSDVRKIEYVPVEVKRRMMRDLKQEILRRKMADCKGILKPDPKVVKPQHRALSAKEMIRDASKRTFASESSDSRDLRHIEKKVQGRYQQLMRTLSGERL